MTEQLSRRWSLFMLLAMSLSIGIGLAAWGPIPLLPAQHHYADSHSIMGLPHGMNALLSLPMGAVAIIGWHALRSSGWPLAVQRAWRGAFATMGLSALLAAAYHLAPGDAWYLAAQAGASAAYLLMLLGFLAERVAARFGSRQALSAAAALALLAALVALAGQWHGAHIDLRPLLLLQMLPVLLIPAGALSLPGRCTRRRDWLLVLGLYAAAKLFELADEPVLRTTGWISGHALMHLTLAALGGWLAFLAAYRASSTAGPTRSETPALPGLSQASTSLNTSG